MSFKEYLKSAALHFFIIVTLADVATFIVGMIFRPEDQFGYEAFLTPLIYGALGVLPNLVMCSGRELTVKQIMVRKAIQLLVLEAILITAAFGIKNLNAENLGVVTGFALSVLIIFLLVHIISWLLEVRQAEQMTAELLTWQKRRE